jgi:hypothetical protein
MSDLTLFKSRVPSCSLVSPAGITIVFSGGRYATNSPKIVEFLEAEIEAGNPLVYVDPQEKTAATKSVETVTRQVESVVKGMASSAEVSKGSTKSGIADSLSTLSAEKK